MTFEENRKALVNSCMFYLNELKEYNDIKDNELDPINNQARIFLKQDIDFVEGYFKKIQKECGPCAAVILWMIYVQKKTQKDISAYYGIPLLALRKDIHAWEHMLFDEQSKN